MIERGPVKASTMETMEKFERGMGLTLKNAWLHAEAVQVRVGSFISPLLCC